MYDNANGDSVFLVSVDDLHQKAEAFRQDLIRWRTKTRRTATADGVRATVDGHLRLVALTIDPEATTDLETLGRSVCTAVSKATAKASEAREKHDGFAAGGLTSRMWEVMFGA